MIDVAIPSDSNIREGNTRNPRTPRAERGAGRDVKVSVVPVVMEHSESGFNRNDEQYLGSLSI